MFKNIICLILVAQFKIINSSDDEDDFGNKDPDEEEWHMDFMPTGYLPDSVYRELAWYGILQIQPLHHSTKHKVAAHLIWQHTLGRPHVIMESPPQSTQSEGKVSRQILAEEAAKWSREQRAAQEVLMENIKSGGNGLTVRTVVSAVQTTTYIVQNGNYYKCPEGTEPDLDAYRVQANMHERKCTYGKSSIPVAIDPCIEAEVAPIEYSFHEGWMFCLGNGERENNYFQNGTLDCGNKTKDNITVYNGPDPSLPFAASSIFQASIKKWRRLTANNDYCKAVYEVSFDIEGSNFNFKPGDTIGIVPHNNKSEVEHIINHLGLQDVIDLNYTLSINCGQKGAKIPSHVPVKSTLRHILIHCVDLRGIVKKLFLLALSQYTKNESEKQVMEYLCSKEGSMEYTTHILNKRINVLDLFTLFKSCKPPVEVILEHLPRLLPRPYSIVNSRHSDQNTLKICFSIMDIGNNRKGLTTGWLEEIILQNYNIEEKMKNLNLNNGCVKVPIYLRKNLNEFYLPDNTEIPLILIGPGTGVSPFIGFLEQREYLQKNCKERTFGSVWLFFGCRNPELDFIYEDELKKYASQGIINKLNIAFSRKENSEFRYVQDAILENGAEIAKLIMQGAQVYVCGDIKVMAVQVKDAITQCIVKYGNKNKEEAENYISIMQKEKRYLNDIWN